MLLLEFFVSDNFGSYNVISLKRDQVYQGVKAFHASVPVFVKGPRSHIHHKLYLQDKTESHRQQELRGREKNNLQIVPQEIIYYSKRMMMES